LTSATWFAPYLVRGNYLQSWINFLALACPTISCTFKTTFAAAPKVLSSSAEFITSAPNILPAEEKRRRT
jgi:hypothetical protein